MAKRKASSDEDEHDNSDYQESSAEEQPKPRSKRTATHRKIVKEESDSEGAAVKEEDELDSDEPPLAKKPKTEPPEDTKPPKKNASKDIERDDNVVKTSSEGDKYINLGKKKRATVRSFKGISLVDIREFYEAGGEEKPGKKGISLTLEQWETLKTSIGTLDELLAAVKKKK
ncbi:transcriptional Coactivator p15-domain-containing protein [Lyophyllum atratum]|nr:transcriptional Coactivator p15-domain-containing protein [Lyophyllum atratum]